MTIYIIRAWANERIKRGHRKGSIDHYFRFEEIIIDNLETARAIYEEKKREVAYMNQYAKIESVKAELFIPHVHENGRLAYWPDPENGYIEIYNPDGL